MREPTPDDNAKTKPAISPDTVKDLKAMAENNKLKTQSEQLDTEDQKAETAWKAYAGYGEYYQRVNKERAESAKVTIEKFGPGSEVTIIASINVDPVTGEAIDGHDYRPEAQGHKDIEKAWQKYLAETPPEERFVIFEGDSGEFDDRDVAIRERTEAGLLMYLADQSEVARKTGEPTNKEVSEVLEKEGQPKELTALLFALREQSLHGGDKSLPDDLSLYLYNQLVECGVEGFEPITPEQKEEIGADPQKLAELKDSISKYIATWNEVLLEAGLSQFTVGPDGSVGFENPVSSGELAKQCNPAAEGGLSEYFAKTVEVRDRHIFDTITDATKAGKKPFVVYGGSHVVSLEPVLQEYYGGQQVFE